jgi:hypothetical protein
MVVLCIFCNRCVVLFVCRSVLMLDSVEYVEFVLKYPSPVGIFWDLLGSQNPLISQLLRIS